MLFNIRHTNSSVIDIKGINTLEELLNFVKEVDTAIIIKEEDHGIWELEIYDDYRE